MYPGYENCAKFIDEKLKFDDFDKGMNKYQENHKEYETQANANLVNAFTGFEAIKKEDIKDGEYVKSNSSKFTEKIKNNLDLIVIAVVIIGIGVLAVVLLIFLRRNRI